MTEERGTRAEGRAGAGSTSPLAPRSSPLPPAVWWFGATSLANDFSSEIVYPLLPAFVTQVLGGGALALGLVDGIGDAVAAALKLVSGYLAERPRLRGPLVVAGYGLATALRPLMALAAAPWHVIALRAGDRVGKGLRTAPRDVMIADVTEPDMRGRAFGLHRVGDHTGAILGPLVAAALIAAGLTLRHVFWVATVPGVIAVVLASLAVRKAGAGGRVSGAGGEGEGSVGSSPAPSTQNPAPLITVLALAVFLRVPETLLLLRAQQLGVGVAAVPLLWALLHVVRSAASYPGGIMADRWGPRRTMALGWLCYAALAWALAKAAGPAQAVALFAAYGVVAALTESPERKLVAAASSRSRRGRGFGWYHGALAAVALPGAALFGWLYQVLGADVALKASCVVTIAAIFLLGIVSVLSSGTSPT
jgi:MFS family permease